MEIFGFTILFVLLGALAIVGILIFALSKLVGSRKTEPKNPNPKR